MFSFIMSKNLFMRVVSLTAPLRQCQTVIHAKDILSTGSDLAVDITNKGCDLFCSYSALVSGNVRI